MSYISNCLDCLINFGKPYCYYSNIDDINFIVDKYHITLNLGSTVVKIHKNNL